MVLLTRAAGSLLLCACMAATATLAQTSGAARLGGHVRDGTGSPLPGVTLELRCGPDATRPVAVRSDVDGRFLFQDVPGGNCTVRAALDGYATIVAGPIDPAPGRETTLDLTMRRTEELQETVEVEGRGETVDVSSTSTSAVFNEEFIEGVPLVGRSFSDLLTLAPGVTDADRDGNVNVRGARDTGMQLRLDGTNATDPLTGHFGQSLNLEAVQDVEVITAGAPAEYGRADGGFANVVTKSGGNETTGSLKAFYRSQFLDGAVGRGGGEPLHFTDLNLNGTLGGALVKDHLWYFAALEWLDEETPVPLAGGDTVIRSATGWRNFAKITLQAGPRHKLALQLNQDPLETRGNNIGPRISPDTDYELGSGGSLPQFTWTAVVSPQLLMQTIVSRLETHGSIDPLSPHYRDVAFQTQTDSTGTRYVSFPCLTLNCVGDEGIRKSTFEQVGGPRSAEEVRRDSGPYNIVQDSNLERLTLRSDLSYTIEDAVGQHGIRAGFQSEHEKYDEDLLVNPILTDHTCVFPYSPCLTPLPNGWREGSLELQVFDPARNNLSAEGFNIGGYLQDAWKPLPNLTIHAGVRLDREDIDSTGFTDFDPADEARQVLRRYDMVCEAAGSSCVNRTPGRMDARLPGLLYLPEGSPAAILDLNGDGILELSGNEGRSIYSPYTTTSERVQNAFRIVNNNVAPRLSIAWDPVADGRTRLFSSWGRFYDRLFLGTVVTDQKPTWYTARWELGITAASQVEPGEFSGAPSPVPGQGDVHISLSTRALSIAQTERNLKTPYMDEFTAGIERELAPEWAASLTYIRREGRDLLQDIDVNHITCGQFDETFGVDSWLVCENETDKFGRIVAGQYGGGLAPNGAPDLYNLNPNFNQILRVGNFNESHYSAWEAVLRKRLHRNWQMQFSYTWSTARGQAESFTSQTGNDPAVSDRVSGYLAYDQRHVVKFQAVAHLPHDLLTGASIQWSSGLPYSLVSIVEDYDDNGLITPQRVFSQSGEMNDQRNNAQFTIDLRAEKRFNLPSLQVSGFLAVENLLDDQDIILSQVDAASGVILQGERRPGRRFEIGTAILF